MECAGNREGQGAACACGLAVLDCFRESRLFACDDQLTRAVVVDRTDNAVLDRRAGLLDFCVLKAENCRHAAVNGVSRVLHQLAALGHDFHAVRERNHACRRERSVLAERKACRRLERDACLAQRGESRHGVRKNSDLAVFGARKGLLVTVEAQLRYINACAVAGFLEYQTSRLRILIKVLAHAGSLCALTREKCKTIFHVCSSKN